MSEETNKSDGNGSDEIDIFLTDSYCGEKYMTQIPKNATVKDLVKKVKDLGPECFDPKYDKKYFALVHGLTMITTSANIGKTTADLGIEEGSNIRVVPRDRLIEENQDGFIEIKKLETEKESEQTRGGESLILRITRKIKSFFSWLYELFFGGCNSQTETINDSQISTKTKNESQVSGNSLAPNQETKNVPHTASRTENLRDRSKSHRGLNFKHKHEEDSINTDINRQG